MSRLGHLFSATIFGAALLLALNGCAAIPPAITLASLGVDLGSFALTGKTASDHLLSAAAGEDCRLTGVLEGEICREEREFEVALAVLQPLPEEGEPQVQLVQADGGFAIPSGTVTNAETRQGQTVEPAETEPVEIPPGFKVPSGTVVIEEEEPPIGGFVLGESSGGDLSMPVRLERSAGRQGRAPLALTGYLSDETMPRAPVTPQQVELSAGLEDAVFLSQAGLGVATDF